MRKLFLALFILCFSLSHAQAPEKWSSAEIYNQIKKLNFLGSVLYIAAHPDDENTRLISYFSNEKHARTAYLSLTRGDGGQNLIGPELREQLGLIRTQELLAARKIDGGEQFFTRANDFGYSKTPSETLEIWNKKEVLSDVVWIIRKFRPDVIINRFDHRTPGSTHGHHTSSAILSVEAFDLAGSITAFDEQLEYVNTFEPKRLFFNTSPWFYGGSEAFKAADKSNFISFDTGNYFPLKGLSNTEIASISRSQHRSQGFGSTGSRGTQIEYLELLEGDLPAENSDVFEGIDTSWNRLKGGKEIGNILAEVENNFEFTNPSKSLPQLLEAYELIQKLEDAHWREIKTSQIKKIIYAASGMFLEAVADKPSATPSEELGVSLEAINRSDANILLTSVELTPNNSVLKPQVNLLNNAGWESNLTFKIPETANYTNPYWLEQEGSMGMYAVKDQNLKGLPETPLTTRATFHLNINGTEISFEKPVVYKFNDNVYGETYKNFEVVPPVDIKFQEDVLIFNNQDPKEIIIQVTAKTENITGVLDLKAGPGWKIEPVKTNFSISQAGGSEKLKFRITPPETQNETRLLPEATVKGKVYNQNLIEINYDHIPDLNLIKTASLKLVKLDIKKKGNHIAYIEGAGDIVPESLEQIGYNVTKIAISDISMSNLMDFDAVVLGIRAYNVLDALKYKQDILHDYVKKGGTMIVQYNTNRGLVVNDLSPYKLNLSRDRVTNEKSEIQFLAPDHPVLNSPNKISRADFEGWVQERGLYFPGSWDENFTAILSMHDSGETPKHGSLLVAKYGDGHYIYTGLSFFRQFPEAVPGAFRLFANLISIGK
ncbi:PIG-L family deacetylase [Christiangramia sabulilitoris]|uniref:PIG-L family deacetylase n=1 Tax=Christiangramia sabulilitoris TaxID=2583991 RepID=A0A550I5Q7_9FLAO|nr:PIG-L family deacetylase [Christiangramia sabulilitoris]TRO66322.1 PIG-L family deacetylase [Christiangramia sabulilitoris]